MLRGLFFQAWGSLTSLKSQTLDPKLKVPPGGLVLRISTSWKKFILLQPGLNPQTLDLEASTLSRDRQIKWIPETRLHLSGRRQALLTWSMLKQETWLREFFYFSHVNKNHMEKESTEVLLSRKYEQKEDSSYQWTDFLKVL